MKAKACRNVGDPVLEKPLTEHLNDHTTAERGQSRSQRPHCLDQDIVPPKAKVDGSRECCGGYPFLERRTTPAVLASWRFLHRRIEVQNAAGQARPFEPRLDGTLLPLRKFTAIHYHRVDGAKLHANEGSEGSPEGEPTTSLASAPRRRFSSKTSSERLVTNTTVGSARLAWSRPAGMK